MNQQYCYLFGEPVNMYQEWYLVKIGCTNNPTQRLHSLRSLQPSWEYHHVWYVNLSGAGAAIEKRLHDYYSEFRIKGELFKLHHLELDWLQAQPPEQLDIDRENFYFLDRLAEAARWREERQRGLPPEIERRLKKAQIKAFSSRPGYKSCVEPKVILQMGAVVLPRDQQ